MSWSTVLLAMLAAGQGLATLAIDLSRTHATHPDWLGHARFHVVWQCANAALTALVIEYLLWSHVLPEEVRFHLALVLAAVPMLGFLVALVFRRAYGGTLSDPKGIPPLRLRVGGRRREIDLNTVAVVAGLIALGFIGYLHSVRR